MSVSTFQSSGLPIVCPLFWMIPASTTGKKGKNFRNTFVAPHESAIDVVDGSSTRQVSVRGSGGCWGSHDWDELSVQTVTTIGVDIAKSVFQVHGFDAAGNVAIRRQITDYGDSSLCWRRHSAPCLGASAQLTAGGVGARPDHPISGHRAFGRRHSLIGAIYRPSNEMVRCGTKR